MTHDGCDPLPQNQRPVNKNPKKTSCMPGTVPASISSCYHALHTLTAGLEFGGSAGDQLFPSGCLNCLVLLLALVLKGEGGWLRCVGDCGATLCGRAILGYGPAAYSCEVSSFAGCGIRAGGVPLLQRQQRRAFQPPARSRSRCCLRAATCLRRCRPGALEAA